jgi:negative regulator of sigma E activity
MSDCERLSDRMPDVALQRAAWSAEEAGHLASCASCRAEWDLVLAALRLEASAPSVDPATIAAAVQHRLASERMADRRSRWGWVFGGTAAAAALVVVVARGPEYRQATAPAVAVTADPLVPLPELEGLDTAQLDTLLQALDGPLAGSSAHDSTTADDDVDAELEQILATWEG